MNDIDYKQEKWKLIRFSLFLRPLYLLIAIPAIVFSVSQESGYDDKATYIVLGSLLCRLFATIWTGIYLKRATSISVNDVKFYWLYFVLTVSTWGIVMFIFRNTWSLLGMNFNAYCLYGTIVLVALAGLRYGIRSIRSLAISLL